MKSLVIHVRGIPKPKGSMKHVGRGRMVEQVVGSKEWRQIVAIATRDAMIQAGWSTLRDVPIMTDIYLWVPRPASVPRRVREWPTTRSSGDSDKHARNVHDAITDAGAIGDDAQIVKHAVTMRYDDDHPVGATITVEEIDTPAL